MIAMRVVLITFFIGLTPSLSLATGTQVEVHVTHTHKIDCRIELSNISNGSPHQNIKSEISHLQNHLNSVVLGQPILTRDAIIALLVGGHILVEGPHGTAKTRLSKALAESVSGVAKQIQFTPDLMPSDITGAAIFNHETRQFDFYPGPIFANIVLAEEINRAPERTQSATLEAMESRQVTVGGVTRKIEDIHLVIATQNPRHQMGTYSLPEAQLDRFMFNIKSGYMTHELERKILDMKLNGDVESSNFKPLTLDLLREARTEVFNVLVPEVVREYITSIVSVTREAFRYTELKRFLEDGVSPRATLSIVRGAQAIAWLRGSNAATREDVDAIVYDALRHRLLLTAEAKTDGVEPDEIIRSILSIVARARSR